MFIFPILLPSLLNNPNWHEVRLTEWVMEERNKKNKKKEKCSEEPGQSATSLHQKFICPRRRKRRRSSKKNWSTMWSFKHLSRNFILLPFSPPPRRTAILLSLSFSQLFQVCLHTILRLSEWRLTAILTRSVQPQCYLVYLNRVPWSLFGKSFSCICIR